MFNKLKGVPNSHLGILYTYIAFGGIILLLIFLMGIQTLVDIPPFNMGVNLINKYVWLCTVGALLIFSLSIPITDLFFYFNGYRSKYQIPLHKVVRAFYKKNNAPFAVDSTGKAYQLSNSELGDRNKAIRHMYLKPYESGLILVIPCSRWGFLGVSSSVIDNLRDERGSLDLAQGIVHNAFTGYRFSIRHYYIKGNRIYWYLVSNAS